MARRAAVLSLIALAAAGCGGRAERDSPAVQPVTGAANFWNGATVYFLLTDRFANGDSTNDHALGRQHDGSVLRSFEGGDLAGPVTVKGVGLPRPLVHTAVDLLDEGGEPDGAHPEAVEVSLLDPLQ